MDRGQPAGYNCWRVSRLSTIVGGITGGATAFVAAHVVHAQTIATWERGPQPIDATIVHSLWVYFLMANAVWLLKIGIFAIWRRGDLKWSDATFGLTSLVAWALIGVPDSWWQRTFVVQCSASPKAVEILQSAAERGELSTVRALLVQGVPVNGRDNNGNTALHAATYEDRTDVARYLLQKGADIDARNRKGESPLFVAEQKGSVGVATILRDHAVQVEGRQ